MITAITEMEEKRSKHGGKLQTIFRLGVSGIMLDKNPSCNV